MKTLPWLQAYADGNLSWKAAFEAKYSWMSLSLKAARRRSDWDPNMTIGSASERWGLDAAMMLQRCGRDSHALHA